MVFFWPVVLFFLGASVGSFINVLVWRKGKKKKILGRSFCDHCRRQLFWWENIPLISFIVLRAKCRTCRSPIPFQYWLVELLTGIIFFLVFWLLPFENIFLTFGHLLLAGLLIAVFLFDFHYQIIPDWTVFGGLGLAFLIHLLNQEKIFDFFLVGVVSFLFFLLLHLITKGRGMGLGDVKFSFFMGFFLGFPRIILAFYLAFLTGAFFGVILILLKKKKFGQQISFGPFLTLAAFVSWLGGEKLLKLLVSYFL